MSDAIPRNCRKFRAAIVPLVLFFIAADLILFLGFVLLAKGWRFDRHAFLKAIALAPILSVIFAWMIFNWFPVALSAEGIYGHSFLGTQRFVAWRDVADVRSFRLANLRWLRILAASDGRVTWLALFQSHGGDFLDDIKRFGGADGPLLKHLR